MSNKYHKYQLTYPYVGTTVYRSKSMTKAVKKCYNEFKHLNDINEGMFAITDLDDNMEYKFKAQNKKIYIMDGGKKVQSVVPVLYSLDHIIATPKKSSVLKYMKKHPIRPVKREYTTPVLPISFN